MRRLLLDTAERIATYRESLAELPVAQPFDPDAVRTQLGHGPLPDTGTEPSAVVDQLADAIAPCLVASAGPRYFGFVTGGSLDAATAADLLAVGWDQNAFNRVTSPAAALVEEVAGAWVNDVLGLPATSSVGFTTGGQGANTIGLAAGRHAVLARAGWDVERDGLIGAPPVRVLASEERHATIDRSLRLLGLGTAAITEVPVHGDGAIDADALATVLNATPPGPTIVCLQAGNVSTGACDDFPRAIAAAHGREAWVHVDGAFGLWAAASPATRPLVAGMEAADSWACDAHKWLNVPYDSGLAICAHPDVHIATMSFTAAYLVGQGAGTPSASDLVLESSRRARAFAVWAALRQLGRQGVADLVDRCCALAHRFEAALEAAPEVDVVAPVVLNQVLVDFGDDARTDRAIAALQAEGTCWAGGTTWRGRRRMRISVSGWSTTEADVDRSVAAIKAAASA